MLSKAWQGLHFYVIVTCPSWTPPLWFTKSADSNTTWTLLNIIDCQKWAEGRPHMFESTSFETEVDGPRWENFGLDMCLTLGSLVLRLVHLFSNQNRLIPSKIGNLDLNLTKQPSWIGVENGRVYPIKEGPTLKPSSKCYTHVKTKFIYRAIELRFETSIFKCV